MSRSRTGNPRKGVRFFIVSSVVVLCFVVLASRLVFVQGVLQTELKEKADRQLSKLTDQQPQRHPILDRRLLPLAEAAHAFSCYLDPTKLKNKRLSAQVLARQLGVDEGKLYERIEGCRGRFLYVKRNIPADQVQPLQIMNLAGVGFEPEWRRNYPLGAIASHLLGMVGVDGRGLSGIELKFDGVLSGGIQKEMGAEESGFPAGMVQLTLDGAIQSMVERELDWGARKTGAKRGMAMVQDPWTGEILSAAYWPPVSLEPDRPPESTDLRVPFLTDVFEPGSTFKVVIAASSLEENLFGPRESFDGENGAWKVADIVIHDHEPRKRMSFNDVFVYSSNIGTAKIADRVGSERLFQYARLFGFGVYPGTGLSGEAKGVLRTPTQWSGVSKNVISFGQEVGVTAVQLLDAYSAIANGGNLMEPQFVKAIVDSDKNLLWENKHHNIRRVISPATADRLKEILTKVVEEGTGKNAQIRWSNRIRVAGKTGTAQKFDKAKGGYCDTATLISFCGFFPVDHPKYTVLVILDEPQGRAWGGIDAAPVFRRIAEQLNSGGEWSAFAEGPGDKRG